MCMCVPRWPGNETTCVVPGAHDWPRFQAPPPVRADKKFPSPCTQGEPGNETTHNDVELSMSLRMLS